MKPISVLLETKDVMQVVTIQGSKNLWGGGGGGAGCRPQAQPSLQMQARAATSWRKGSLPLSPGGELPAVSARAPCRSISKTH